MIVGEEKLSMYKYVEFIGKIYVCNYHVLYTENNIGKIIYNVANTEGEMIGYIFPIPSYKNNYTIEDKSEQDKRDYFIALKNLTNENQDHINIPIE